MILIESFEVSKIWATCRIASNGLLKDIGYKTWSTINKIDDEDTKKRSE